MMRLYFLLILLSAPLAAVAPHAGSALTLESATVEITIAADHTVSTTIALTIRNPGEAAEFALELADNLVPVKQHKDFTLTVSGSAQKPEHDENNFTWMIRVDGTAQVEWTLTGGSTSLPHVHPLGKRELAVRLAHLRSYAALPENIAVTVRHSLPGELFGRDNATPFSIQHPSSQRIQDFSLSWFASTLESKRAKLAETLETFTDKQPTAENRLYTTTLAHVVDLAQLAGDHAAVAIHCEALANLETQAGKAITVCGPWAEWRRYVPWQLLRLRALEAAGSDTNDCAKLAVTAMVERWPAYLKAKTAARPFDEFDVRFGGYWDYDWKTTRELYARALEINGDAEAAKAVAGAED